MNYVVLFSGQGAQKSGMGLDFMSDPLFEETIERASVASKQDIVSIFKNKNGELNRTVNVQPALVAFEAGIFQMLRRDISNLKIVGMLGLSLGEYGAMFASNALDLEDTLSLVSDRAKYMQEDADQVENAMVALVKPNIPKVEAILAKQQKEKKAVYIANYNSPRQIVIGGQKQDVLDVKEELENQAAAMRVVELDVNGAFHTPLFKNASKKMHQRLKNVPFHLSQIPVISNTTVQPFTNDWAEIMEEQISNPTHFGDCLQYLINNYDIDATLEIGPGKTLSAFTKQVDRKLKRQQIGTFVEYQKFVEEENGTKK